jgi:hypothetical protein
MNRMLSSDELQALNAVSTMTLREKRARWAELIAKHPHQITMLHGIEYMGRTELRMSALAQSIFAIAADDAVFRAQGHPGTWDAQTGIDFFSLSRDEVHYLACDCMGQISNATMAARIKNVT